MSLLITLFVPEGIVIAGDSRLTLTLTNKNDLGIENNFSIIGSDTNRKIFNILDKYVIGTFGAADIAGTPISGFINQFIEEKISADTEIYDIPNTLHEFFGDKFMYPNVYFYVAGYGTEGNISKQHVYLIDIHSKKTTKVNEQSGTLFFGANWGGEIEILERLICNVKVYQGSNWKDAMAPQIPYNFFTLQDAVDFCRYAINTTINTLRFQGRPKTVGGEIDIAVITPKAGLEWVSVKKLQ